MPADMKTLARLSKNATATAKRLQLDIDQMSAFNDGTYRVDFKERPKEQRKIGFKEE